LLRPINGLIAFISVFLGAVFANGSFTSNTLIVAISAFLVLSAGNAINDFCDYQIDGINKPMRPIPSQRIQRQHALIFSLILLLIGLLLGFFTGSIQAIVIVTIVSITLFLYAVWLKKTPLIGNVVVGALTGVTFIAGGVTVRSMKGTIVPAAFAFLFTTAREIIKDIEDIEGDVALGAGTIAVRWGKQVAALVASVFMLALIFFSLVPYLLGLFSWIYLVMVTVGVDFVLIFLLVQLWRDTSKENCAKIQQWMKLDIFVGLFTIYLGSFV
jgi:geranylgeranylglycerol-phosphate geranylgeranyltransferase